MANLQLPETEISDAGLVHLRGLTKLRSLNLVGTFVTKKGIAELAKSLPNCEIYPAAPAK